MTTTVYGQGVRAHRTNLNTSVNTHRTYLTFSSKKDVFSNPSQTLSVYVGQKNPRLQGLNISPVAYNQANRQEIPSKKRLFDYGEKVEDGYLLLRGRDRSQKFDNIIYHLAWFEDIHDGKMPSQLLYSEKNAPLIREALKYGGKLKSYDKVKPVDKPHVIMTYVYHKLLKDNFEDVPSIIKKYPSIVSLEEALEQKAGNCAFTSMLYKVMADEAGLPSTICYGSKGKVFHFWNETQIDGEDYLIDISGGGHVLKISDNLEKLAEYRDNEGQLFYSE